MYRGELTVERAIFIGSLIRTYDDSLKRFVQRNLPLGEEVEDIVQEVYFRIWRRAEVGDIQNLQAFVFRTALNLVRDRARRSRVRERTNHVSIDDHVLASLTPSPERVIAGRQSARLFEEALGELPPKCRRVFVLQRFEGMTYTEIAAHFDISKSAVEKHMSLAISHLAKRMGEM